jgi:hypothetical protein
VNALSYSAPHTGFAIRPLDHYPGCRCASIDPLAMARWTMNVGRLLKRFRISAALRPYVLRVRLRGSDFDFGSDPEDAVAFTKCMGEMREILVKRGIPVAAADRAILRTMEATVDFQLSELRYRSRKTMGNQSQDALDRLIKNLRLLGEAIARLPPTSKGELNRQFSPLLCQMAFDTEIFVDIIETVAAALPKLSPQRHAKNALMIIHPELSDRGRSPIIDLWETMPPTTRVKVEKMVQQAKPSKNLVGWLNSLAELLDRERPARKRGSPTSISQHFVSRVAAIWHGLGLNPGLAFDFHLRPDGDEGGRGGRVASGFQSYCHSALAAVGDSTRISARQVTNYKKKQRNQKSS